jgi:hypothetical protein
MRTASVTGEALQLPEAVLRAPGYSDGMTLPGTVPGAEGQSYGIHAVWALPDGNGIGVCCGCRAQTEIIIDMGNVTGPAHIDLPEQAFTCGGCGTVHWFRLAQDPS